MEVEVRKAITARNDGDVTEDGSYRHGGVDN